MLIAQVVRLQLFCGNSQFSLRQSLQNFQWAQWHSVLLHPPPQSVVYILRVSLIERFTSDITYGQNNSKAVQFYVLFIARRAWNHTKTTQYISGLNTVSWVTEGLYVNLTLREGCLLSGLLYSKVRNPGTHSMGRP